MAGEPPISDAPGSCKSCCCCTTRARHSYWSPVNPLHDQRSHQTFYYFVELLSFHQIRHLEKPVSGNPKVLHCSQKVIDVLFLLKHLHEGEYGVIAMSKSTRDQPAWV